MAGFSDRLELEPLWTDRPDAPQRLAESFRAGALPRDLYDDLLHFIDHGWLIWHNAIEPHLIDAFVRDIRALHHHPGAFVTTNHRRGSSALVLSGTTPDRFESLFDLYVNLPSARDTCLNPRITRFLSAVFESRVIALQQLVFQRSNGHTVHQDTSVVAVEHPLKLAATWIALEDVVEGSGELGYYDRSHKLPHYVFESGGKLFNQQEDNRARYIADLRTECERRGLEYKRFLARKGDVLFWAADLVHCSHPRTLPEDTSRLSCVTHYYPATTIPFWFRYYPDHQTVEPYDMRSAFVSAHYRLPTNGKMLRPTSASHPAGG